MIKNVVRYAVLFLISIALFMNLGGRTLFLMVAVLIIFPWISLMLARIMTKKMQVNLWFEKDMIGRGSDNVLNIEVENSMYIPSSGCSVWIEIENYYYNDKKNIKVDVPIRGHQKNKVLLKISSDNSGYIVANVVKIVNKDLLALFNIDQEKTGEAKYMVMPANIYVEDIKEVLVPDDDATENLHEVGEDTSEIESIREYIPGDRMQRIHWKLSGKLEELMVKEYALNYDIEISLVCELNINNDEKGNLDDILDGLYSILLILLETNERLDLYFVNKAHNGVINHSISSESDVLDAFAQIYYIKPYTDYNLALSYAKAQGVVHPLCVKKYEKNMNEDHIVTRLSDKVVLTWE